ncbi:hypothetical protein A1D22_09130 [Pasteurellaceae bacterium LFhippo2]|nr:hypothetical protein [Pasteurellaceae bacterium LFhippo2]
MSLNQVNLIGFLGDNPEIRTMKNGKNVATLSVATSFKSKQEDGTYKDNTEWHKITVFNQVNFMQYLKKGDQVYIRGRLHYSNIEENGIKRYFTEIICEEVQKLSKDTQQQEQAQAQEYDVPY